MATAACIDEVAAALPPMGKVASVLQTVAKQRALHLERHPDIDANAVFNSYDIQEIHNTWMEDGWWVSTAKCMNIKDFVNRGHKMHAGELT